MKTRSCGPKTLVREGEIHVHQTGGKGGGLIVAVQTMFVDKQYTPSIKVTILRSLRFRFSPSEHVSFENLSVCVEYKICIRWIAPLQRPKTPKTPGSVRKRSASFRLELPRGDALASTTRQKMVTLKEKFRAKDQRLNNADIIERALDA